MNDSDFSTSLNGRQLVIREVLDELDPADRDIIVNLCEEVAAQVRERGRILGQNVRFTAGDALELIWETLIFEADPHGKFREDKLKRYARALQERRSLNGR